MNEQDARRVLEAVLFSSSGVLSVKEIVSIIVNIRIPEVRHMVQALNADYEKTSRTFRIVQIGEGYQMRTLPMYKTWIVKAEPLKPVRLTQPSLETLAIVAYRQPVTRAGIEHVRGTDCSYHLRRLLDLRLVRILGKDKGPGRAILYGTSRDFLSLFNLTNLNDLPTLEEFDLTPQDMGTPVGDGGGMPGKEVAGGEAG